MTERENLIRNIQESAHIAEQMRNVEAELLKCVESADKYSVNKKPSVITIIAAVIDLIIILFGGGFETANGGLFIIICSVIVAKYVLTVVLSTLFVKNIKNKAARLDAEHTKLRNDQSMQWLPDKYRNSTDFNMIASYLKNDRADTLREAINILEQESHYRRMENAAAMGAYYYSQN